MSVVVVIPSRGRPARAAEAVAAIRENAVRVATSVVLAVDADDPYLPAYQRIPEPPRATLVSEVSLVTLAPEETGNLVKATNTVSLRIARENPDAIIGNLGDDHVIRTAGWDRMVEEALTEPGIAYGDDLIHGEGLPSAPFISASIVNALGWYFLPTTWHLYCDDAVRELGLGLRRLTYIPELVTEHVHPAVGKADFDEGYIRANAQPVVKHDHKAYLAWRNGPNYRADIRNVTRAIGRKAA